MVVVEMHGGKDSAKVIGEETIGEVHSEIEVADCFFHECIIPSVEGVCKGKTLFLDLATYVLAKGYSDLVLSLLRPDKL